MMGEDYLEIPQSWKVLLNVFSHKMPVLSHTLTLGQKYTEVIHTEICVNILQKSLKTVCLSRSVISEYCHLVYDDL